MKKSGDNILYTIEDIVSLFPRCTEFMVRNWRYKTKAGEIIDGIIYYTADEVTQFVEETEFTNILRRNEVYETIKKFPGITEEQLCNYLPFPKYMTRNLLAEISESEHLDNYKGLYEEDDEGLYVEGFEKINKDKICNKNEGIFLPNKKQDKYSFEVKRKKSVFTVEKKKRRL